MKIGAVCQETGLTDRTVRYYIEEGLLNPTYTKSYVGRKSFEFTEENVTLLQNIAVLRKYGFSIADIKAILEDPTRSGEIAQQLIVQKKQTIRTEQLLLDTLKQLDKQKHYTVPELAAALDSPVLADVKPPKDPSISGFVVLFLLICLFEIAVGILVTLNMFANWHREFLYIHFYPFTLKHIWGFLRYMFPVLCVGVMLLLYTKKLRKKRILHAILTNIVSILYLITWLPLCLSMAFDPVPPIYSETQDIQNYLQVGSIEEHYLAVDHLFPDKIPEYALSKNGAFPPDTTRYYNITERFWEPRCELFAQWKLSPEELEAEKVRLESAFPNTERHIINNEAWTCWVFSNYPEDSLRLLDHALRGYAPQELSNYDCTCFAYRQQDGLVRYIDSYSHGNLRIPIFMQLDWT